MRSRVLLKRIKVENLIFLKKLCILYIVIKKREKKYG